MHRTRQYLHSLAGNLAFIEEPPAPEGGGEKEPPEGAENTPAADDDKSGEDDGEQEGDEDGNDFDTLPDWAQAEIKKLRKGEAKYRTTNKDLQEALKAAKSQDDIDAAVRQHQERNAELEIELATAKHTTGFSPEQLALVHGSTPEEIEESAEKIRAAFATRGDDFGTPNDPHADGGVRPGRDDEAGLTPQERARRIRERSGRRGFRA